MATYNSSRANPVSSTIGFGNPSGGSAAKYEDKIVIDEVAITVVTWTAGDVYNLFFVPLNAVVLGLALATSGQLDTNVSPTSQVEVGDVTNGAAKYIAAANFGQSSGPQRVAAGFAAGTDVLPFKYTAIASGITQPGAADLISATVPASHGAATLNSTLPTLTAWIMYYIDNGSEAQ